MSRVPKAVKVRIISEVSAVLLKHYGTHILMGDADGSVAWAIIQDVRKHLELSEDDIN